LKGHFTLRKIIAALVVSVDGFIEGPNGELDWVERGDALPARVRIRLVPRGHVAIDQI
jgi:hypothetical protein